jgi:hypothetical protein
VPRRRPKSPQRRRRLAHLTTEELLDLRLSDLGARWEGGWLQRYVRRVQRELLARDLRVRPHFWVSDEWFSPDGVPGVAIPFYLTHKRLIQLERKQMLFVEGDDPIELLRLLRHEVGHAVQHAFELHRRRRWQRLFGPSTMPYPELYRPNPGSRRYVIHLPYWYGQSHPAEDFAETFAVWLTPRSGWRRRYEGWPALAKLEYVDELMAELAGRRPSVRSRLRVDPISRNRTTLREYYAVRRDRFQLATTNIYDEDLRRLFRGQGRSGEAASTFLRRDRAQIRRLVARNTGKHPLAIDSVLGDMIARCRELQLRAVGSRQRLVVEFAVLLAARSVEYALRGREWHAL